MEIDLAQMKIYAADQIFTGETWLTGYAVITTNGVIDDVVPLSTLSAEQLTDSFSNCFIAPAFIDLQIYGAASKLFSVYPEPGSLHKLKDYCAGGGAAFCMPTIATNTIPVFYKCIDAVKEYWEKGGENILGLHLEGPWLNPAKRGAHISSLIHSPSVEEVKKLLEYGKGVIKIVTLAPEVCSNRIIDMILAEDIIISAGHSNATFKEAKEGFANGITAVTHLYNAMSPLQHREPGLVGAAMDDDNVMCSIIPDGYHVDFAAIHIAKEILKERLFVITDAVTTTEEGPYKHYLAGDKYEADGVLSGSALTMNKAVKNLVDYAGIELGEALRMCSLYPAKVINEDKKYGRIERGHNSSMIVLNNSMEIIQMI